MRTTIIPAAFIFLATLAGCENDASKNVQTTAAPSSNFLTAPLPANTNTATNSAPSNNNTVLPVSNNTSAASGINPAHGQPGHRCDIAVGAPLNSAPPGTTQTQKLIVPNPQVNSVNPNPATTTAATTVATTATTATPGMNPQHGQPGHRCDIAVGAPLNSAPANKTTAQTITPGATVNNGNNVNPPSIPVASTGNATATAPGMNPQHGQPGHRCDIAVGAPLDSKPKQ